ncbi:MAG: carboxypeptidase regulatory-like domain-containing protein [Terracidiphilus sp.]
MRRLVFILSGTALFFPCLPATAQEQVAPQTVPSLTSTVSGRVICGDTGHPARFAAVQLIPEKQQPTQTSDWANVKDAKDLAKLMEKGMAQAQKGTGLSAVSAIDGSFEMPKVPAGTYFVVAQLKGYLSPLDALTEEDRYKGGADAIKRIQAQSEKIVVQDAPVRVDVRLERGGSINGVIRYDDGSPAVGVTPVRMVMQEDGKWKVDSFNPGAQQTNTTDDCGHYRISGLAKGKYAVKAELPTMQSIRGLAGAFNSQYNVGDALVVYSGGAFREKDIKPIEIGAGEDVDGIDIAFPIDDLHVVSGTVTAKTDNHPVNAGWVSLNDPETKAMLRHTKIEEDGSFKFSYVPEGQYELKIGAADTDKSAPEGAYAQIFNPTILRKYQDANLPIEVKGDQTGLVVQVADKPAAETPTKPQMP